MLFGNSITFPSLSQEPVVSGTLGSSPAGDPPAHPLLVDVRHVRDEFPASATDRHQFAIALLFAVILHTVLLSVLGIGETHLGGQGVDLDAMSIEVTLVPATAAESRKPQPDIAAGATGPVEISEGAPTAQEPAVAEVKPSEEKPPDERAGLIVDPAPALAPEPSHIHERKELVRPLSDNPVEPKKEEAASPTSVAPVGGTAARAIDDQSPSTQGMAAARPGDVQRYARSVVEALGRSRPKGLSGANGTARVSFQISQDGSVVSVRIVASSGNPKLDGAAKAAVEAVKFPPPPPNMTAAQLTYEIPYHFR